MDAVAQEVLAKGPSAGFTIAVARGGREIFAKGYGQADVRRHIAATGETIYPICSISKNFTAAAILKLVEGGQLDLDQPIPGDLLKRAGGVHPITARQLLNHTSGLGSYNDGPAWDSIGAKPLSQEEVLGLISGAPKKEPGDEWGYSNSAFYIAGMLVEQVSGKSYWEFLETAFFQPLGMRHTSACTALPRSQRAQGYRAAASGLEDAEKESWENPFSGGGLCATAGDLLLWQAALDSGRALRSESVRAMRTPTKLSRGPTLEYGLGTRLGTLEGHSALGHTGGGQGFSTVLSRYPADDLTIVVFRNSTANPQARVIAARLARRLLGLRPFAPLDLPVPNDLLEKISGNWMGDYGAFRLRADRGRLRVELGDSGPTASPSYQGGPVFAIGEEDLVRLAGENGRCDWSLEYVGGLFDSAAHRIGP